MHNDEDRRVTYQHIRAFYQKSKQEKFEPFDFIYYFGHALKGKEPEVYQTPVSRNLDDVKKEVFKKIDIKSLGASQGKKVKKVKKLIEDKLIDIFQKTHFGIAPMTEEDFKKACIDNKVNPKHLQYNPASGLLSNACMSPHCAYYLQPMKPAEFTDHMRLWRKTLPVKFHMMVVQLLH